MAMGTVLAVDPSTRAIGWAVFKDGKYLRSGVIECAGFNATVDLATRLMVKLPDIDRLVCEDMSFHRNPTVMKTINTFAAAMKTVAVMRNPNVEIFHVYPQSWQGKLLGAYPGMDSAQRKALSRWRARDTSGKHEIGPDEADAVCIGEYHLFYGNTNAGKKPAVHSGKKARRGPSGR